MKFEIIFAGKEITIYQEIKNFQEFIQALEKVIGIKNVEEEYDLGYFDDEGDKIDLVTQSDFDVLHAEHNKNVKIVIEEKPGLAKLRYQKRLMRGRRAPPQPSALNFFQTKKSESNDLRRNIAQQMRKMDQESSLEFQKSLEKIETKFQKKIEEAQNKFDLKKEKIKKMMLHKIKVLNLSKEAKIAAIEKKFQKKGKKVINQNENTVENKKEVSNRTEN